MKSTVVVDSSIAIKWVLEEPNSAIALELLDEWIDNEKVIVAPALLAYEITNIIHKNVRGGEITVERAREILTGFFEMEITFDTSQSHSKAHRALELAHRFGLSATYDAYFLALAECEECELWTADKRLWNAVKGKLPWVRSLGDYHPDISRIRQ
ncbi:MAG: type II toxin-antitoxin system VapC family toxin [Ktedonobacteraceae bacterium]